MIPLAISWDRNHINLGESRKCMRNIRLSIPLPSSQESSDLNKEVDRKEEERGIQDVNGGLVVLEKTTAHKTSKTFVISGHEPFLTSFFSFIST
jgi:hypothetical protein